MQLQVVYGNPIPKSGKKARKVKKRLLTRKNVDKIEKVGGNSVAKKKKKSSMKKGSAAAKAWGRKMKKLRAASANPKRKRKSKSNPKRGKRNASGYIQRPVYRKQKFRYPNEEDVLRREHMAKEFEGFYQADMRKAEKEFTSPFDVFMRGKKEARHLAALNREAVKAAKAKERAKAQRKAGQDKLKKAEAEGAKVVITKGNPMAKRKKRKKSKKVASNPRKKRAKRTKKASKKKGSRRKSSKRRRKSANAARVFKVAKTFKFRRAKKKVRVKMVGIVNPIVSMDALKALAVPAIFAAGGVLAINYVLIPLIDKNLGASLPGGSISGAVAKIPVVGEYVAPYAGTLAGMGLGLGVAYAARKYGRGSKAAQIAGQAAVGAVGLGAALIALDIGTKYIVPQLRTSLGLSGVRFFPGHAMSGPDFGMYPQMGNSADFGVIPQGMRGVEFFPKKGGMNGVEYFPEGSNGDDMYRQSEAGDLMEAEGLGEIPEGMGSPDFGEIPEGLGEPQMG
jgi:hypothetical protein